MPAYYVNNNAQPTGEHEVHVETCSFFPSDRTYLGSYDSCAPAVAKANETHSPADGCYHCCRPCHTR